MKDPKAPKTKNKLKKFSQKTSQIKADQSASLKRQKKAIKEVSEEESDYINSESESSEDFDDNNFSDEEDERNKKKGKKTAPQKKKEDRFAMEDTDKKQNKDIKQMFQKQQSKQEAKKENKQQQQQMKQMTLTSMFAKRTQRKVSSDSDDSDKNDAKQNKMQIEKENVKVQQKEKTPQKSSLKTTPIKKKEQTPQKKPEIEQQQQRSQTKSPMKIKEQFQMKKITVKPQQSTQKPVSDLNQIFNKDVENIMAMGLPGADKETVTKALKAAGNNTDKAVDFLLKNNVTVQNKPLQSQQSQQKKPVQQQQVQQQQKPKLVKFNRRKVSSSDDDVGMELEESSDDNQQIRKSVGRISLNSTARKTTPLKAVQPIKPLKPVGQKDKENLPINEKSTKLEGLIFVLTGVMSGIDRDTASKVIANHGGKCTGSISGKTDYLIIGEKLEDGRQIEEGSKYRKANELDKNGKKKKVKIINEEEFNELLQNKIGRKIEDFVAGNSLQSLLSGNKPQSQPVKASTLSITPLSKTNTNTQQQQSQQPILQQQQKNKGGLWTTFYAPKNIFECVGNNDKIKKIAEWLTDWEDVVIKKTLKKDIPVYKNWGGGGFPTTSNPNKPAILLSGPPGIGKTTTVRLLASQMGYELIESNASDIRNKKGVDGLLNHLIDNQTLGFNKKQVETNNKKIILMDEVDGMSSGDRGGNQELIKKIDNTKTPIICICNDRQHQKVRTLANHCYDIEFSKPTAKQIQQRMSAIIKQEELQIDEKTLLELIESLNCDIRQTLNCLQMWNKNSGKMSHQQFMQGQSLFKKDQEVSLTGFDAAKKLMNRISFSKLKNMYEKVNLFMIDYDQIPIIVQNQYLESNKKKDNRYNVRDLEEMLDCSNSIAEGDILNNQVRGKQHWGLLPNMAIQSAIYPCETYCKEVPMIKFPAFLGKFSAQRKVYREIRELRQVLGHTITGSRFSTKFDYARPLLRLIVYYLEKGKDYIDDVIDILVEYNLTPDIVKEQLLDAQYPSAKNFDYMGKVQTATKTALTKAWKEKHSQNITKKKVGKGKAAGGDEFQKSKNRDDFIDESDDYMEDEDDEMEEEEEESSDIKLVQVKQKGQQQGKATKGGKTKKTKK